MYNGEAAPKHLRGTLLVLYQLMIIGGLFLSYVIDLGTHSIAGSASWRIPVVRPILPCALIGAHTYTPIQGLQILWFVYPPPLCASNLAHTYSPTQGCDLDRRDL